MDFLLLVHNLIQALRHHGVLVAGLSAFGAFGIAVTTLVKTLTDIRKNHVDYKAYQTSQKESGHPKLEQPSAKDIQDFGTPMVTVSRQKLLSEIAKKNLALVFALGLTAAVPIVSTVNGHEIAHASASLWAYVYKEVELADTGYLVGAAFPLLLWLLFEATKTFRINSVPNRRMKIQPHLSSFLLMS